jgi:hypothetical protein
LQADTHAGEKGPFQVAKQIASQDAQVRIEAQSKALAAGPEIIPALRDVQSAEAKEIVDNYDKLIQSTDKNASRAAIKFFSQRKAPSFLAGSLPDIANADMKLVAVQQMRAMGTNQVASVLTTRTDVLASEDVYRSGSEAAILHALYMEELTGRFRVNPMVFDNRATADDCACFRAAVFVERPCLAVSRLFTKPERENVSC